MHEDDPEPATLVLRVEGPVALEIQHLSGVIIEKVNRYFGWRAVGRIQIRQAPLMRREKKVRPAPPDPAVLRERRALRRSTVVAIEEAVPPRPWRGPAAGGHPESPE